MPVSYIAPQLGCYIRRNAAAVVVTGQPSAQTLMGHFFGSPRNCHVPEGARLRIGGEPAGHGCTDYPSYVQLRIADRPTRSQTTMRSVTHTHSKQACSKPEATALHGGPFTGLPGHFTVQPGKCSRPEATELHTSLLRSCPGLSKSHP